jgi:Alpha-L-arabinofuranosidase B (ABFB) domain/Ricin-type beta-trefoil lectin domain-like
MRPRRQLGWFGPALCLTGACSLHSLDYLDAGAAGGGGLNAAGAPGAAGQAPSGGAGAGHSGGKSGAGTASGAGGTDATGATGNNEAGAATSPPEAPDCNDGAATVDETDVDCGGRTCEPCAEDNRCLAGTDCLSAICTNQVCQPPTCSDLAVNGDETDLNCGGACDKCEEGKHCVVDGDCVTKECTQGMCTSTICKDDVLDEDCPLLVDNTPYSLAPAHAPTKCIDDKGQSVSEGTDMILFGCKAELHQTFWAVARADGFFAFRSALSGKCLQVRDASMAENAVIEQSACDFRPEQLWKPSIVSTSLMQLTSKLSGLALDVAGANVTSDFQAIVQGKANGSADTRWRVVKRTAAAYVALSPYGHTSTIGHDGSAASLGGDDDESSHWKVVSGLSDPSLVSFQSRDEPGRYLRHAGFRVWSDTNDGSTQFKRDASFRYRAPLAGGGASNHSFEASNFSGHVLKRDGSNITLNATEDTAEFKSAATWTISAH